MVKKKVLLSFALILLFSVTLASCMTKVSVRKEFDDSIEQYKNLLSAQSFDAAGLFAIEEISDEFSARAKAAKNIKIVDYRVLRAKYDELNAKAEVEVEIDYYSLSFYRVKTIRDTQKWAYITERGETHWRLTSLLPEFP